MRGVVLAGGTGSRLLPLTRVTNKHLLPVGRDPMIFHAVRKLVGAGIEHLLVVTGVEHMGHVVGALGSGAQFGCELTYRVQDEAGGIAQALGLARDFARGPIAVILADNLFEDDFAFDHRSGAHVFLKEVADPHRFGVPAFDGDRIVRIDEKPSSPASPFAVTGLYLYDEQVFDIIDGLTPSARGELEITDVNNAYLQRGALTWSVLDGWWTDAGTHASYARANRLVQRGAGVDPGE